MRSPLIVLAALIGLAGCSFDAEKPDIFVHVTNIDQTNTPTSTTKMTVTLSFAGQPDKVFQPQFSGTDAASTVDLALSSGGQVGAFTISVQQLDRDGTNVGLPGATGGTLPLTGAGADAADPLVVNLPSP